MKKIFEALFGCWHLNFTRPFHNRNVDGTLSPSMYVVCLDCARKFPYDFDEMKVIK